MNKKKSDLHTKIWQKSLFQKIKQLPSIVKNKHKRNVARNDFAWHIDSMSNSIWQSMKFLHKNAKMSNCSSLIFMDIAKM